jgi:hypothetical protein
MDYSQYVRLKQEAANVYIARNKPVDASFLTMQKQQKASYSGSSLEHAKIYFNGQPVVNQIAYDKGSCPKDHEFTQGYISTNPLAQQQAHADRAAGAVLCGNPDYSVLSPGLMLKNPNEVSTILTSFDNNVSKPGQWKSYGYGVAKFFPVPNCSTINKYPHPSG